MFSIKIFLYMISCYVRFLQSADNFDPLQFDYCAVTGDNCSPTQNPNTGEHPACRCEKDPQRVEVFANEPSKMAEFRQTVLDVHNEMRNYIASGKETRIPAQYAADMMVLNWDNELEHIAKCRTMGSLLNPKYGGFIPHEPCTKTHDGGDYGQNFACQSLDEATRKNPSKDTIRKMAKDWYEEEVTKVQAHPGFFSNFDFDMETGHFTQIIWSRATRLGCALVWITPGSGVIDWCGLVLLCNYYSDIVKYGGNMLGDYIYKQVESVEQTCSKCHKGTSCNKKSKYPYLCGKLKFIADDNDTTKKGNETNSSLNSSGTKRRNLVVDKILVMAMFALVSVLY